MRIQTLLLLGLCTIGIGISEAKPSNAEVAPVYKNMVDNDPPYGYEIIILQGDLMYGNSPNAIVAGANENSVYLRFNKSFGNVNISVYNDTGMLVYGGMVNTDVQQILIIPITNAASGNYSVELSNATGSADGDFDHN